MPFYIKHTDGTNLVTVSDGTLDNSATSLTLIGKNFPTYGYYLNQNLVSLTENFAAESSPDNPLLGQIWYDSKNKNLNFYREGSTSNAWHKLSAVVESATAPVDPRQSDLWWDTTASQLKLYDAETLSWIIIGPQTTSNGQLSVIGNNSFTLQVGGNTVMEVDQYGGIKKALNSCVSGYDNVSGSDLTSGGVSSFNTWIPTVTVDRGHNFDTGTGIFTANTTGIYRVNASVTNLGNGEIRLQWWKNGSPANVSSRMSSSSVSQLVCSGIIGVTAGDSLQLVYATDSGASISNTYSTYEIQLIG